MENLWDVPYIHKEEDAGDPRELTRWTETGAVDSEPIELGTIDLTDSSFAESSDEDMIDEDTPESAAQGSSRQAAESTSSKEIVQHPICTSGSSAIDKESEASSTCSQQMETRAMAVVKQNLSAETNAGGIQSEIKGSSRRVDATSIGTSQPEPGDHPDQAGFSSTKPIYEVVGDSNVCLPDSQVSQKHMPQPAIESTAASPSREAVNNGDDHQPGASGNSKQAECMSIPNCFKVLMQTDKNCILVPKLKLSFGPKRTASDLEELEPSRQVAPKKIKSTSETPKEEEEEEDEDEDEVEEEQLRKWAASPEILQGTLLFAQSMKRIMELRFNVENHFVEHPRCASCSKFRRQSS
ncbi:hypothetical protein EIK77_008023 [Talaromyces pinophilus]|nr:hypothetical protein EIK77_008023 [Talaromyces pinophilus]